MVSAAVHFGMACRRDEHPFRSSRMSPTAMSAIPPRCLPCSGWASRSGPFIRCRFSNHTGYETARGRAFDGGMVARTDARPGRARRAATLRWRAVGLYRFGRDRRGHSRRGGAGQGRPCAGLLLLRSGDRRCRPRRLRGGGCGGVHAAAGAAGGRYRDAEPLRVGAAHRRQSARPAGRACGGRDVARARAARRSGDLARHAGDAGRRHRSARLRRPAAAIACAPRACRLWRMARATSSPRCSSRIFCNPVHALRRCRAPPPRCSAYSGGRPRPAPRKCCWSKRRTSW